MTREEAICVIQAARPMNGPNSKVINAALNLAIAALREQEERENPQPLTLDELRQIHAPIWCSRDLFGGGNGFRCLCENGKIITPSRWCFDVEEIPNWFFLRSKPKEDVL